MGEKPWEGAEVSLRPGAGLLVGSEVAGAALAAAVVLRARDEGLETRMTGVFLSAGIFLDPGCVPEQLQAFYRSRSDERCIDSPQPPDERASSARRAVEAASMERNAAHRTTGHANLPRTYVQACGLDLWRDDGILYAHVLRELGNEVRLDVYSGAPHGFWHLVP